MKSRSSAELAGEPRAAPLGAASRTLVAGSEASETLDRLVRIGLGQLGDLCTIDVVQPDSSLRRVAVAHADPGMEEFLVRILRDRRISPDSPLPPAVAARTGTSVVVERVSDDQLRHALGDPDLIDAARQLGVDGQLSVPLVSRGRVLGVLSYVSTGSDRQFGAEELAAAEDLAGSAAIALENALLLEAEHIARQEAERAQQRLAFLTEASSVLASSLDERETLASLSSLAIPRLADWASVTLVEGDGQVRRFALAHADASRRAVVAEMLERSPFDPDAPVGVARVLRTGEAEAFEVTDEILLSASRTPDALASARALGLRDFMCVPLRAGGRVIGALSFATSESGRRYGPEDLAVASELAARAAMAVDHARLFREVTAAEQRLRGMVQKVEANL
ncbi:MAG: GAF domain-containing protein, partial [Acidimicrobiales bacterium]